MNVSRRSSDVDRLIMSLGALAAGFALGLLYRSPRGLRARVRVTESASRGVKWLDRQLDDARKHILEAGDEAADQLRAVMEETIEKVVPDLGTDEDWNNVYAETDKEVRRSKQ